MKVIQKEYIFFKRKGAFSNYFFETLKKKTQFLKYYKFSIFLVKS